MKIICFANLKYSLYNLCISHIFKQLSSNNINKYSVWSLLEINSVLIIYDGNILCCYSFYSNRYLFLLFKDENEENSILMY